MAAPRQLPHFPPHRPFDKFRHAVLHCPIDHLIAAKQIRDRRRTKMNHPQRQHQGNG